MVLKTPPPFKLGQKQIFLPTFIVSMTAPARPQPPNYVNFQVPLSFNKFDLRDYLHNLYGVNALAVRSWVRNARPTRKGENYRGKWYRPQASKFMSVRLASPFVIPEKPKDLTPWDHELYNGMKEAQRERLRNSRLGLKSPPGAGPRERERNLRKPWEVLPEPTPGQRVMQEAVAARARKLLRGEEKWENGVELDGKWEGIMRAREETLRAKREKGVAKAEEDVEGQT